MFQTALVLAIGALVGLAIILLILAARHDPAPDLQSAIEHLSGDLATSQSEPAESSRIGQLGGWLIKVTGIKTASARRTMLQMRGYTPSRLYGEQLLCALVLAVMPWPVMALFSVMGLSRFTVPLPALATVVLAVMGWFYPLLAIRRQAGTTSADSSEALLVYIDLVVLERLANETAVDALTHAAFLSGNPLFVQIQKVLNRAALENVDPWRGLEHLAEDISLPELNDVVAIARLQEQGASLAASFRARVAELRNAYLLRVQNEAQAVTSRMDIAKALPTLAVITVVAAAPLLSLMGVA